MTEVATAAATTADEIERKRAEALKSEPKVGDTAPGPSANVFIASGGNDNEYMDTRSTKRFRSQECRYCKSQDIPSGPHSGKNCRYVPNSGRYENEEDRLAAIDTLRKMHALRQKSKELVSKRSRQSEPATKRSEKRRAGYQGNQK